MRSISMAYPTIDLAATGAHIRQLRLEQGYSVQDLQAYLGLERPRRGDRQPGQEYVPLQYVP